MVKKIIVTAAAVLMLCCSVFSFGFESNATTIVGNELPSYYLPYPEPNTTENQGYMVVVDKYGNTNTYFWQFHVSNSPSESISADIRNYCYDTSHSNHWGFGAWGFSDSDTSVSYDIYKYDSKGRITLVGHTLNQATCINPGQDVIGVKLGGNVYFNSLNTYSHNFNVYFDSSGSSTLLYEILCTLQVSDNYDSSMADTLSRILNQCTTANEQLTKVTSYLSSIKSLLTDIEGDIDVLLEKYDELIAEQKKSNSWLEKIFNWLEKSKEEEKQEATTQGSSSANDGMNAIEDKGGDFTSSLGNLVGSMGYNGTDCSWTFPAIKLPAIPGVMDEVTLSEEYPIDFSYWVNQIPSGILLLIRSLFTAFLVVYCFRELYGTIEYVLTLRRGGGSE